MPGINIKPILKACYHKIFSVNFRKKVYSRRKLASMMKKNPSLKTSASDKYRREIYDYWLKFLGLKIYPGWHIAYASVNGIEDARYIPEYIFFNWIIPLLNKIDMYPSYTDKNNYSRLFKNSLQPKTFLRNMQGVFYDPDYRTTSKEQALTRLLDLKDEFIIKPSIDTGQGKNIRLGFCRAGSVYLDRRKTSFEEIEKIYKSDFLIQEKVVQHPAMSEFHPHSLNTVRVMTLRLEGETLIISAVVRFGDGRRITDNRGAGGICTGVDAQGKLNCFGIDNSGRKLFKHPFSKLAFEGATVPSFHKITRMAISLHTELPYFNIASWDIGLNRHEEPVLIELNLVHQELDLHQFNNGPVLKDYLKKIMPGC